MRKLIQAYAGTCECDRMPFQAKTEVDVSIHTCMNDYLRCKKCEVLDPVCEHVIRARKNVYQDF